MTELVSTFTNVVAKISSRSSHDEKPHFNPDLVEQICDSVRQGDTVLWLADHDPRNAKNLAAHEQELSEMGITDIRAGSYQSSDTQYHTGFSTTVRGLQVNLLSGTFPYLELREAIAENILNGRNFRSIIAAYEKPAVQSDQRRFSVPLMGDFKGTRAFETLRQEFLDKGYKGVLQEYISPRCIDDRRPPSQPHVTFERRGIKFSLGTFLNNLCHAGNQP